MGILSNKLAEEGVELTYTKDFTALMAREGYDPAFGARPVKRLIQRELVNRLATSILNGSVHKDSLIEVDAIDGKVEVRNRK